MTTLFPQPRTAEVLPDLTSAVTGRVLLPGADGYAALATPWNLAAVSAPEAVVEVTDAADVAATIRFAGKHGLDIAVQATGHGATIYTRPTILIHTGLLDTVEIDPTGSARAGAGVRWQAVLDAAAPFGFGALAGSAPGVGIVGYHTGGGISPVARTYGYASDRVTAFDVVTGDGEIRRATATQNPALFWGLRGGKGALGVVTAIEFDLLPESDIYGGALYFDGADAATVVHAWREWTATLPEQASTSIAIMRLPAMPAVPPPLAGRTTVAVRFAWLGDPAEGERVIAGMQSVAPVILGGIGVLPFAALGAIHADPTDPMPGHESAMLLRELPARAADALLALTGPGADCPQLIVELRLLGGAISRPPAAPSALCHRDAAFALLLIGIGVPPLLEPTVAHADAVLAAMSPWDGGGQPNFGVSTDPHTAVRNYDAATLARLASLAETYDPHGLISAARPIRAAASPSR